MKKLVLASILATITLVFVGISYAEIDPETAVGIWLFDEGSGDVAEDSSGNGNDGTLEGGPQWVDGMFNKALEFDGSDDYVGTEKQLLDSLDEFTIVLWAKPGDIVASRVGLVGQNDAVEFGFINPNQIQLWTPTLGGVNAAFSQPKNEWYHIAGVGGSPSAVYIDGEVAAEGGTNAPESSAFNVNIGGGGVYDGSGNWFTGVIDDVAIFNIALTADDIKTIMNDGLGKAVGITAVSPAGRLTTTWGRIKNYK